MLGALPLDSKLVRNLLKTAVQRVSVQERLYVKQVREEKLQDLVELVSTGGQGLVGQDPEEVAEVRAAVEADPRELLVKHKPARYQFLCKVERADAMLLELLEVNSVFQQEVYRVVVVLFLVDVEVEVELPSRNWLWHLSVCVRQRDAQLDYLQDVYICLDAAVLALLSRP